MHIRSISWIFISFLSIILISSCETTEPVTPIEQDNGIDNWNVISMTETNGEWFDQGQLFVIFTTRFDSLNSRFVFNENDQTYSWDCKANRILKDQKNFESVFKVEFSESGSYTKTENSFELNSIDGQTRTLQIKEETGTYMKLETSWIDIQNANDSLVSTMHIELEKS